MNLNQQAGPSGVQQQPNGLNPNQAAANGNQGAANANQVAPPQAVAQAPPANPPPVQDVPRQIVDMQNVLRSVSQSLDRLSAPRRQQFRPRAIACQMFRVGDNWPNFSVHFVECVQAAYGFELPAERDELHAACLTWLPSKLEPGPTHLAYTNLSDDDKARWPLLDRALRRAFLDETERETFLSDMASFKRGTRSLIEYRNELGRLMQTHQPDLTSGTPEYNRQIVVRFIEGLDNISETERKELRRYCKREKANLDSACNWLIDLETSELQSRIRAGEPTRVEPRKKGSFSLLTRPTAGPTIAVNTAAQDLTGESRQRREEIQELQSKQKITEMRVQELVAGQAFASDRMDSFSKEVVQLTDKFTGLETSMNAGFSRVEAMLANPSTAGAPASQYPSQYTPQGYQQSYSFRPIRPRGMFFRGNRPIRPSLTGGVGFVNNAIAQPSNFRPQDYGSRDAVRPAIALPPPTSAEATPKVEGAAQAAISGESSSSAAKKKEESTPDSATTYPKEMLEAMSAAMQGEFWSPGMEMTSSAGYEDASNGLYYYGENPFWMQ